MGSRANVLELAFSFVRMLVPTALSCISHLDCPLIGALFSNEFGRLLYRVLTSLLVMLKRLIVRVLDDDYMAQEKL